ncbi:MAG TPA: bacteriochlorophyll 4-vinyl reductase [Paracoccaceae bacterium]|nr:bacteriochlorophyll 4-vinyl reductase [Paracoccaceae bacterium]
MDGMHSPVSAEAGLIGPNALLQLISVLDRHEGRATRDLLFEAAGVAPPPPDAGMWPEDQAGAVHRMVRQALPDRADGLLRLAGQATADYILANRIPAVAQVLIRALPGPLAARVLSGAIERHAWTFAGSGRFRIVSRRPLVFEVAGNPLIRGEVALHPMCHWHAAVFERLFRRLVWRRAVVEEAACAAVGAPACRFEIRSRPRAAAPQGWARR